jgi:hypothetical protein
MLWFTDMKWELGFHRIALNVDFHEHYKTSLMGALVFEIW